MLNQKSEGTGSADDRTPGVLFFDIILLTCVISEIDFYDLNGC